MTTSVSLMMHGDLTAAWRANPAGVCVCSFGFLAVVWLGLLAGGMPRCNRFSAESAVLYLAVGGATVVLARYGVLICQMLCSPPVG